MNGCVENICQRHLSIFAQVGLQVGVIVLTFNRLHARPHHSKPHRRHVTLMTTWLAWHLEIATWAPGRMALKPQDWRFVISFRRGRFERFGSDSEYTNNSGFQFWRLEKEVLNLSSLLFLLFPISFWSLLYLLHLCRSVSTAAVSSISAERLDGQIQVVSTESSAFRELNGSKSPPEATFILSGQLLDVSGQAWTQMNTYS